MNRTQLRSFHTAAELGGFTAAAKSLSISQPTITTQVRSLEAEYGVELFVRNGRNVRLTPVGEELYEITKRITLHETEARQFLQAHAGNLAGHLRLAAVGPFHATDVLVALKTQLPEIQVSVLLGNSQLTLQRLLDFDADVAMIAHFEDDPKVEMVPFSRHRVVVFVYEGHRWFGKKSISLAQLKGEGFILREQGSTTRLAFEQALERAEVTISRVVEIGSREAVWKAVEQGLGVGVVADFEFVPHPRLATVEISDVEITTNYHIAYLKERRSSRLIQTLVRIARSVGNADLSSDGSISDQKANLRSKGQPPVKRNKVMSSNKIGFIGLGRMGCGMASQLLAAGFEVAVYNRTAARADSLVSQGAKLAQSARQAAEGASAVFSMVADDEASKAVWIGPDGALAGMRADAFVIECSTISHDWVEQLASQANARQLRYIDSPVTGLPDVAARGDLTLLLGAASDDLADARSFLEPVSANIVHFGPVGTGTAYKLMINLMGAVQIAAAAEGMAIAEKAGLDLTQVAQTLATGQAASPQVVRNANRMAAEDHETDIAFTPTLRLKDAAYGVQLAHKFGLPTPFGDTACEAFKALCDLGLGDLSESKVIEVSRQSKL